MLKNPVLLEFIFNVFLMSYIFFNFTRKNPAHGYFHKTQR